MLTKADKLIVKLNRRYGGQYMNEKYGSADFYGVNSNLVTRPFRTPKPKGTASLSEWDEYPYASTAESGIGSIFAAVDAGQNSRAGTALLEFYRENPRLVTGCKFLVRLAP